MPFCLICRYSLRTQTDTVAVCKHAVHPHARSSDLDTVKRFGVVSEPLHGRSGVRMGKDLFGFLQPADLCLRPDLQHVRQRPDVVVMRMREQDIV